VKVFICNVCISLCTPLVYSTAQNSSDDLPSCRPSNHHCSGVIYCRRYSWPEDNGNCWC